MTVDQDRERIRVEAAEWVVRLSDGQDDVDRTEFRKWRANSPEHDLAYERAFAAWERFDRFPASRHAEAGVTAAGFFRQKASFTRLNALKLRPYAAAVSVAAVCIGATLVLGSSDTAYATTLGETRLLTLSDRSQIQLNSDSSVRIHYDGKVRRIELLKGEVYVAPNATDARSFIVQTSLGDAQMNGGSGDVRLDASTMVVRSMNLTVHVTTDYNGVATDHILEGGHEARYVSGQAPRTTALDDTGRVMAWRQGAIDLRGQTLAEASNEFNRYNVRKIIVIDPSVAAYRLGGYFRTGDVDGFVRAVQTAFPVKVRSGDENHLLLMAEPSSPSARNNRRGV